MPFAIRLSAALFLFPAVAFAHTPEGSLAGGFAQGLAHVVDGPDHVLALVALALWAAWLGGRADKTRPFALAAAALLTGFALVHGSGGANPLFVAGMTAIGVLFLALSVAAARAAEKFGQARAQAFARAGAVVLAAGGLFVLVL